MCRDMRVKLVPADQSWELAFSGRVRDEQWDVGSTTFCSHIPSIPVGRS